MQLISLGKKYQFWSSFQSKNILLNGIQTTEPWSHNSWKKESTEIHIPVFYQSMLIMACDCKEQVTGLSMEDSIV